MMKTMLTFTVFAPSIPANLSEMTLPAELDDELDMAMNIVPKETKEKKILPKDAISDKILVETTDDELDTSMKNVSKEKEGEKILPKGAISKKTLPEELDDDELNTALKNVPKEAEEKEILLKVAISDDTPKIHNDKNLVGEIIDELNKAVRIFSKENQRNEIFLTKLQMDGCRREVFCQAEQELIKKVSGLSGAKYELFRFDKKLMRNLNMYNRHVKTCKPADEDQDPILLHAFLKNLLTCVKSAYSQVK